MPVSDATTLPFDPSRAVLLPLLRHLGLDTANQQACRQLQHEVDAHEKAGFDYKNAPGSLEVLARRVFGRMPDYFALASARVLYERVPAGAAPSAMKEFRSVAQATVEFLDHAGDICPPAASNGNGPFNALDRAMRRALESTYPELKDLSLHHVSEHVLNPDHGTAATKRVRVISKSREFGDIVTVGVSENSNDAAVNALMDAYALHLFRENIRPRSFMAAPRIWDVAHVG